MATVVNNPSTPAQTDGGSGTNFLVGVILLIVFALIVIFYGIPYLSNTIAPASGPQVQVPDKVDVNVKSNK